MAVYDLTVHTKAETLLYRLLYMENKDTLKVDISKLGG